MIYVKGSCRFGDDLAIYALVAGKQWVHSQNLDVLVYSMFRYFRDVLKHLRIIRFVRVFFHLAYWIQPFLVLFVQFSNFLA